MRATGIDISKWQTSFEPQGNIDFIIQKVSEGLAKDALYDELLPSVRTIERRGGYHYFRTEVDPIAQAEFFFNAQAGQGFKWLAVDYEKANNVLDEMGAINAETFYSRLRTLTEKPILLYTSPYTFRDNLHAYNPVWEVVPLWMAHYNNQDIETGQPETWGNDWLFWQYTNEGTGSEYGVGSTYVDLNVFNGTVAELDDWLGIEDKPVDCCEELREEIALVGRAVIGNDNRFAMVYEDLVENAGFIKANDAEIVSNYNELDEIIQANALDIEKLKVEVQVVVTKIEKDVTELYSRTNTNVGEIDQARLKQIEFVDIAITKLNARLDELAKEVDDCVDAGAFNLVVDKLNERIDGLAGGHTHRYLKWEWFKRLTGYYNQRG